MMHKATFLSYRPSQVAATAILVAIDLNKAEMKSADRTAQGENGPASALGKFNSMILKDDYELHVQQAKSSVSPPSHSNVVAEGTAKSNSPQSAYGDQTLDKAWTRQTSYYTQVSKTRDILPVLKDLVASLE